MDYSWQKLDIILNELDPELRGKFTEGLKVEKMGEIMGIEVFSEINGL